MIDCSFNAVHERDMDILFLDSLVSEPGIMELVLSKTAYAGKPFQVIRAALSETEADLGETDICVVLQIGDIRVGLLIEDKVDALAMPDQYIRYHERGKVGIQKGKYDAYEVFIFCPEKYHDANSEAKKYDHFISYEKFKDYFDAEGDVISRVRSQQLEQAIERAKKPPEVRINEAANLFYNQYMAYQRQHYPELDLRTSEKSNGWWPRYSTRLGDAYILHKRPDGFVDLTFPNAAGKVAVLQNFASWLRDHDVPNVAALKTGRAAALRIKVPRIPLRAVFEQCEMTDIRKCFDAVQTLTDIANLIEDVHGISAIKSGKRK